MNSCVPEVVLQCLEQIFSRVKKRPNQKMFATNQLYVAFFFQIGIIIHCKIQQRQNRYIARG